MTKRFATTIALMLFVVALPAAGICCVEAPASKTAAMQASMPCCAGSCAMTSPKASHENEATLTAAPALRIGTSPAVVIASRLLPVSVSLVMAANDHQARGFSPPPPILLNEQFRI